MIVRPPVRAIALVLTVALTACSGGGQEQGEESGQAAQAEQTVKAERIGWLPDGARDGRVLFAGQPEPDQLERAAQEGVGLVVNLRTQPETEKLSFDEPAKVEALGMRYAEIPITPDSFSAADADRLDALLDETPEGQQVLIHCSSANRVGGLWAVYQARHQGVPPQEALLKGYAAGLDKERMIEATERVLERGSATEAKGGQPAGK